MIQPVMKKRTNFISRINETVCISSSSKQMTNYKAKQIKRKHPSEKSLDFINEPISRLIIKMAIPASVGFFFNTMYNVVDTYFGGQLSTDTLAALSLSFPVFFILVAIGAGMSAGTTALIANVLGEGDSERSIKIHSQSITFCVIFTFLAGSILYWLLPSIFSLFNPEEGLLAVTLNYIRIIIFGAVFFVLTQILNAPLSARGDTKTYRNFLFIGFLLNIGLDPLFMYGFQVGDVTVIPCMKEKGIALATVLIQVIGVFYMGWRVYKMGVFPPLKWDYFRPQKAFFKEIAIQGMPPTLNYATVSLGIFVITYFIAKFGTEAVAGYGVGIRIEQIALVPTIGLNIAITSIVGQNNGAGRLDRAWKSFTLSLVFGLAIMLGVYTPIMIFARPLVAFFTDQEMIQTVGVSYLYIQAITFYSYILLFQANSFLQGIKQPGMIFWIGLYRQIAAPFLVFSIMSALYGVDGVWWGLVIVNWSAALFTVWHVRKCMSLATA